LKIGGLIIARVVVVGGAIYLWAKGGKQNIRDTELGRLTDAELADRYRDATGKERKRIEKEQKRRGDRNKQKRGKKK
jgi:hypothetical protein